MGLHKTTKTFIDELIATWGDIYDTSECEYRGSTHDVILTCKLHKERFIISAAQLIQKKPRTGCRQCQRMKNMKILDNDLQIKFINYIKDKYPHIIFIYNYSSTDKDIMLKNHAGIPDLFILNHDIFIQLIKSSEKLSDDQIQCHKKIEELGRYKVLICHSIDDAKRTIDEYEV